jgi:drug/metabolite transporter superfamily protein YnfA
VKQKIRVYLFEGVTMKKDPAAEKSAPDPAIISSGLKSIRKRRLVLWFVILIYVPAIWIVLEKTQSDRATGKAFAVWLVFLIASVFWAAVVRCPRCGNYFHVNGPMLFFFRKCLHCGLPINADK